MRRLGLAIVIIATILLLYHGYVRNMLFMKSMLGKANVPEMLTGNISQKTTDLVLTDIGLELFGLALISVDGREVYPRRRQ